MRGLQPRRFADQLTFQLPFTFKQYATCLANRAFIKFMLMLAEQSLQPFKPESHHRRRNLIVHRCRGRAGTPHLLAVDREQLHHVVLAMELHQRGPAQHQPAVQASLADAGAQSYLGFHLQRVNSLLSSDSGRRRLITAAEEHLAGRGRILVRPSGTEPLVRIMVEAESDDEARAIAETLAGAVRASTAGSAAAG